ncbi:MAG TPA: GDSL-type esterase/lipase family protein [Myxococcota bacterium]
MEFSKRCSGKVDCRIPSAARWAESMAQEQRARGAGRRLARGAGLALGILLAALLLLELSLQLASRFVGDRTGAWRAGATLRVLCVGDSHTYGALVRREESFPAQLGRLLEQREPGVWSVVNLGVPGLSSTQVRNRLPVWLARYQPDVVVAWSGVNDSWNVSELDETQGGWRLALEQLALRSRVFRLLRVKLHDLALERDAERGRRVWEVARVEGALSLEETWTVRRDGRIERITHERLGPDQYAPDAEVEARAEADYAAMASIARAAGAALVLVEYPLDAGMFAAANRAMRRIGERLAVPVVDSPASQARVPPEKHEWLWAGHPNGAIYHEIARDAEEVVRRAARPPPGG